MTTMGAEDVSSGRLPQRAGRRFALLRDVAAVFVAPESLFAALPVRNPVGSVLLLLVGCHLLYGLAVLFTGVPDYEISRRSEHQLSLAARQDRPPSDDPEEQDTTLESLEKQAIFAKQLQRLSLVLLGPLSLLLSIAFLAGLLFALVALCGGKPNFALLAGVVALASLVELPRLLMRLLLIVQVHASRVETSAAAFTTVPQIGLVNFLLLRRLDPFDLWFWGLLGLGLAKTGQMTRRSAIISVVLLFLLSALCHALGDVAAFAQIKVGN